MTATAHALIGASIAAKVTNPAVGIPLVILSHFVLDIIPHWDLGTNHRAKSKMRLKAEATADVLLGFALAFLIFRNLVNPSYLFIMIIAAQLPDWLEAPAFMFGIKIPPFSWMGWLGHKIQTRAQLPWGLVTQIVVVALFLLLTVNFNSLNSLLAAIIHTS